MSPQPSFLIIDDQKSIAELLKQKLEQISSIRVMTCHSLAEAKQILEDSQLNIEVCLCDLNLPDAPKGETIDLLEEHQITTVVLTGTFNNDTRQALLKRKVADMVLKDSPASIDYAVKILQNLYENKNRNIWLISAVKSEQLSHLEALLKLHRYQVKLFLEVPTIDDLKKSSQLPSMILLGDMTQSDTESMKFVRDVRQEFTPNRLPIMACKTQANRNNAIKLMKYGVNALFDTSDNIEEFYIRLRQNIELSESFKEVEYFSQHDALSGLYNRRFFFEQAESRLAEYLRKKQTFFTLMLDIDHFKSVNDHYGHQKGDEVIRYTSQIIKSFFNEHIVSRLGGEEFCVFGQTTDTDAIMQVCERLRKSIETQSDVDTGVLFTVSGGLCIEHNKDNLDSLISMADKALYASKQQGRNKISLCQH